MKIGGFFSHPLVGILGSIASLVGVILAVYFYRDSIRAPKLTYYTHPARTTVVKAGQASSLAVSFKGKAISGDVTALQIAIWNAGKAPIRNVDILTPVEIVMEGSTPILESTVRKVSRDITQISIDDRDASAGRLRLNWRILEENDGCVVQVIYAGASDAHLSVMGTVVGQRSVDQLRYAGNIMSPTEQYISQIKERRTAAYLVLFASIVPSATLFALRYSRLPVPVFMKVTCILLSTIGIALGVFYFYNVPSNPPFGF